MERDRRSFLKRGFWGGAIVLLVPPTALIAANHASVGQAPFKVPVRYADFKALEGSWFSFSNPETDDAGRVRLAEIVSMTQQEGVEQFWMRFRPRAGLSLPRGLYDVTVAAGSPRFQIYVEQGRDSLGRESLSTCCALLI